MADTTTLSTLGSFCWVDLNTSDAAAARKFYTELFGWSTEDHPTGEGVYTMLRKEGKDACAMHQQPKQHQEMGIPSHWNSYVLVESADETARRIEAAGGKLMAPPFDVMEAGRMAVAQDPTGATFSLWQAKAHTGAGIFGEPGSLCWNELMTNDVEGAKQFYSTVFGWTSEPFPMGEIAYTVLKNGECHVGGLMQLPEEARAMGAPPHWMVHFAVAECDPSFDKAVALGARTLLPPTDYPGVGRGAVLQDPTGAVFGIVQMKQP